MLVWGVLSEPRTPPKCVDGWRSPSIGKLGACSHHGGVSYEGTDPTPGWVSAVALGAGAITFLVPLWWMGYFKRRRRLPPPTIVRLEDDTSRALQSAIDKQCRVRFVYTDHAGRASQRTVQPSSLALLEPFGRDKRTLTGFCYLRGSERTFLLSRISNLRVLD